MKLFKLFFASLSFCLLGSGTVAWAAAAVTSSPTQTPRPNLTVSATRQPTRVGTVVPKAQATAVVTVGSLTAVVTTPEPQANSVAEPTLAPTAAGGVEATANSTAEATVNATVEATGEATPEGVLSEVTPTPVTEQSPEGNETPALVDQAMSVEPTTSSLPTETMTPEIRITETLVPTDIASETPTSTATADLSVLSFTTPTATETVTEEPTMTPTLTPEPADLSVEEVDEEDADIQSDSPRTSGAYESVERMGAFLSTQEWQADGSLIRMVNADNLSQTRKLYALKLEAGVSAKKGDRLTLSRKLAPTKGGALPKGGYNIYETIGVLKVVKSNEEGIFATPEKLYYAARQGDLVRLREPLRKAYLARYGRATKVAPQGLSGQIVANGKGNKLSQLRGWSYIDQGANQSLVPGMKLELYRPVKVPANGSEGEVEGSLALGLVEVADVSDHAAVVRIVKSKGEVRVGDKVRSRLAP